MNTQEARSIAKRMIASGENIDANAPNLLDNHYDWSAGLKCSTGRDHAGGDHADPTGNAASSRHDPDPTIVMFNGRPHTLTQLLRLADPLCVAINTAVMQLTSRERGDVEDRPTGSCDCCERTVLLTEQDRLRAGLCDKCRKAWDRAAVDGIRPDRARWIRQRRTYLAEKDQEVRA